MTETRAGYKRARGALSHVPPMSPVRFIENRIHSIFGDLDVAIKIGQVEKMADISQAEMAMVSAWRQWCSIKGLEEGDRWAG